MKENFPSFYQEDHEREQRHREAEEQQADIAREDEVLYGAHKIGSNTDEFLDKYIEE